MKNLQKAIDTAKSVSKKTYIIGAVAILLPILAYATMGMGLTDEQKIARSREIQTQSNVSAEIIRSEIKSIQKEIDDLNGQIAVKKSEIEVKESAIKKHQATWNYEQGKIDNIEEKDFQTE